MKYHLNVTLWYEKKRIEDRWVKQDSPILERWRMWRDRENLKVLLRFPTHHDDLFSFLKNVPPLIACSPLVPPFVFLT